MVLQALRRTWNRVKSIQEVMLAVSICLSMLTPHAAHGQNWGAKASTPLPTATYKNMVAGRFTAKSAAEIAIVANDRVQFYSFVTRAVPPAGKPTTPTDEKQVALERMNEGKARPVEVEFRHAVYALAEARPAGNGDLTDLIFVGTPEGTSGVGLYYAKNEGETKRFSLPVPLSVPSGMTVNEQCKIATGAAKRGQSNDVLLWCPSDPHKLYMATGAARGSIGLFRPVAAVQKAVKDIALADLDGDGRLDISVVDGDAEAQTDVFWAETDGTFASNDKPLPGGEFAIAGDFNGDTIGDLLIVSGNQGAIVRGRSTRELHSRQRDLPDECQISAAAFIRVQRIDGARAKEVALVDVCGGVPRLDLLTNRLLVRLQVQPKVVGRNEIEIKIAALDANEKEFPEAPTGTVYAVTGKDATAIGSKGTLDEKGSVTLRLHISGPTRVSVLYMGDEKYAAASRVLTFGLPVEVARLRGGGTLSDAVYRVGTETEDLVFAVQRSQSAPRLLYVDIPASEWRDPYCTQNGATMACVSAQPNIGIFASAGSLNNETYTGTTGTTFILTGSSEGGQCFAWPYNPWWECWGDTSGAQQTFTYFVDGVNVGTDNAGSYVWMFPNYWEPFDEIGDYNIYWGNDYYNVTDSGVSYTFRTPGTHQIGFKINGDSSYYATNTITITGKALPIGSLTVNPSSISVGQNATMTATFAPVVNSTGTVTFYANGSSIGSASINTTGVATLNSGSSLSAGSYTITATYSGDANNNGTTTSGAPLTINKVTPTVTATIVSPTITYGQSTNVSVHVSCNSACGQVDYRLDGGEWGTVSLDGSGNYTAPTGTTWTAGSHSIIIKYLGNGSYNPADSNTLTLTINKATPVVTWPAPAPITYGTPLSSAQLNATANVPGTFVYNPSAGTVLPAGSQTLTATFTPTDTTNYNTGATGNVLINVSKAALLVTANNASKTYGAAMPAFSANYSGFVNGDSTAVVTGTPSLTTTATASSPAGTYAITAAIGTLAATNYSFTFANGTLTISKAVLNVSATNASRTYGTANPVFSVSYSGFVNGDTSAVLSGAPNTTTTATVGSPAGTYPITPTIGTLSAANYTFAFSNGNLTVNKAVLTVRGNDATRAYGVANPAFSASFSGFVNGDTAAVLSGAPTITTTATPASPVGTYPITPTAGTLAATNYSFAFVAGTLTIIKADVTITWPTPAGITYGTPLSGTQLNATASVPGTFVYTPVAGTVLNAGSQTLSVTFTPTDSTNYNGASSSVMLTVTKATASITVTSTLNPSSFGDTVTFNVTVTGSGATPSGNVVMSDGASTLQTLTLDAAGHAAYTTSALVAGTHSIVANYSGNANYQ